METQITTRKPVRAVLHCCHAKHSKPAPFTHRIHAYVFRDPQLWAPAKPEDNAWGIIAMCDARRNNPRFAAAGDRLRDWLTVRTLTIALELLEARS